MFHQHATQTSVVSALCPAGRCSAPFGLRHLDRVRGPALGFNHDESGKAIAIHERRVEIAYAPEGEPFVNPKLASIWLTSTS